MKHIYYLLLFSTQLSFAQCNCYQSNSSSSVLFLSKEHFILFSNDHFEYYGDFGDYNDKKKITFSQNQNLLEPEYSLELDKDTLEFRFPYNYITDRQTVETLFDSFTIYLINQNDTVKILQGNQSFRYEYLLKASSIDRIDVELKKSRNLKLEKKEEYILFSVKITNPSNEPYTYIKVTTMPFSRNYLEYRIPMDYEHIYGTKKKNKVVLFNKNLGKKEIFINVNDCYKLMEDKKRFLQKIYDLICS